MDKLTDLLQKLAEQLGTTTKFLWGVLVRQAPISASINIIEVIVLLIVAYFLSRFVIKFEKAPQKGSSYLDNDNTGFYCVKIFGTMGIVLIILLCFCLLKYAIMGFFNPEFWALDYIIDKITPTK